MKRPVIYAAAAALALLARFPFQKSDVAQLRPVEVLMVSASEGVVTTQTDTGDLGMGDTLRASLEDLKKTTAGEIFFDTADYLLVTEESVPLLEELAEVMRPGCGVCRISGEVDVTATAKYLASKKSGLTLREYRVEKTDLPVLTCINGRMYFE